LGFFSEVKETKISDQSKGRQKETIMVLLKITNRKGIEKAP
jgi:hypothetical protein